MKRAYYNENEPYAAQWLRDLIAARLIMDGDVDDRSIEKVEASDLEGYTRFHFFAGIAGWDLALRLAGWPAGRPVWTGSCPCQPFSCAGKRAGEKDERHLWPQFYRLISECRPVTIFGEQTASGDGPRWLDGVSLDLEELGYAVGTCDLPAACVSSPQKRQRLWFVAHSDGWNADPEGLQRGGQYGLIEAHGGDLPNRDVADHRRTGNELRLRRPETPGETESSQGKASQQQRSGPDSGGCGGGVALAGIGGRRWTEFAKSHGQSQENTADRNPSGDDLDGCGQPGVMGGSERNRLQEQEVIEPALGDIRTSPWSDYDIVWCDERASGKGFVPRRVEPGTFPLAHGIPNRVGKLRAYGNAIVPQVAARFVRAYMQSSIIDHP